MHIIESFSRKLFTFENKFTSSLAFTQGKEDTQYYSIYWKTVQYIYRGRNGFQWDNLLWTTKLGWNTEERHGCFHKQHSTRCCQWIFCHLCILSNLAVIVTIIKTPSLQKPCNILLCSLAIADCLTGVTAQPMFIVWRFFLQRAQQSCLHQVLVFNVYYTIYFFTVGLSFVSIVIISFDRLFALSRPLVYIAEVSKSGEVIISYQKY